MKKRFVALLLCLVMVVGLIPAAMAAMSSIVEIEEIFSL